MNLFRKSLSLLNTSLGRIFGGFGGTSIASRLRFLLPGATHDYEREAGDLWANSVVAICLKWIGDNYTRADIGVYRLNRMGDRVLSPNHPLIALWNRPNSFYTGRVLAKAIALSLAVDGNAYLLKVRSGSGKPVQLWWVPHWRIGPCWPENGSTFISHYEYQIDGRTEKIDPRDVIHFRDGLDPRNDRLGYAPLKAQLREICADNEAAGYQASLLRNMGVPGIVLVPANENIFIDKPSAEAMKERFRDAVTGDSRGDAIVLGGAVKIETISLSPEELALDRLPKAIQSRICASLGMSPMVVGLSDDQKTYANYGESLKAAWHGALIPLQDLVAETLTYSLLVDFATEPGLTIDWDYSQVEALQEAESAKSTRVENQWKAGLITRNEGREAIGRQSIPEGDTWFPGTEPPANATEDSSASLAPTATGAEVQATALNGAQIESLLSIVNQVMIGAIPEATGRSLIAAAFPLLEGEEIDSILAPLANFKPTAPPEPEPAPKPKPAKEPVIA